MTTDHYSASINSASDETPHAGRELRIGHILEAPIERVWEVWTKPELIAQWWGPTGFRNTINEMHVEPGGRWDFTMHGPDGTDYHNTHIYRDVQAPEKLVMDHITGPKFRTTITLTPLGSQTLILWQGLFESPEQLEQVIKVFKADEGLKQNIERLAAFLHD